MPLVHLRPSTARIVVVGSALTFLYALFTLARRPHPFALPFRTPARATCAPRDYAAGTWVPRPPERRPDTRLTQMTRPEDALAFAGFQGCASSREFWWHLAADSKEQYDRFPGVTEWEWEPGAQCRGFEQASAEAMVRDLVEQGGWMLVGDSVTENHFFSLSCVLFPHVLATPNYTANPYFDRAWPQNLYLSPSSPLLTDPHRPLVLPPDFNLTTTPLVTFRRIDLLFSPPELEAVYAGPAAHLHAPGTPLFGDDELYTLSPSEYVKQFLAPRPAGGYATMVVSTAGHWTVGTLPGFRDDAQADAGSGIAQVLDFFEIAIARWAETVQSMLADAKRAEAARRLPHPGVPSRRQVVVRAYLPGHEDCHDFRAPWTEYKPMRWNWYNWGQITDFNRIFENVVSSRMFPDIHYLAIDRPASLRPDAHGTGDCLHIMSGAGVLEGWTYYIQHFVSRELSRRSR